MNTADAEALYRVIAGRRDVRTGFRPDLSIDDDVLARVLGAAHAAPSVGFSQPWDFVLVRDRGTRERIHELVARRRAEFAAALPRARAAAFSGLKIEAILDTPLNVVVTCDRTRGGRYTLGRRDQPQTASSSTALAVENLWLAARAEGLGVGWVSFLDDADLRELGELLGLPPHLEVVAYLCVGHVDRFAPEPELATAGWARRRPLGWAVHHERYGQRGLPGAEAVDLLTETLAAIESVAASAIGAARDRFSRMTMPRGSLGRVEEIAAQLCGIAGSCPAPVPSPAAVAVFAGDHGVHARPTCAPTEVTARIVGTFLDGGAAVSTFARQLGAEVALVDVGVAAPLAPTPGLIPRRMAPGTADLLAGPAMTREQARAGIEAGIETARDLVAAGNRCLLGGGIGVGSTVAAVALICAFTGKDPAGVIGPASTVEGDRPAGPDPAGLRRAADVNLARADQADATGPYRSVEDTTLPGPDPAVTSGSGAGAAVLEYQTAAVRVALDLHRPDPADPLGVLAAVGGFEHAALSGFLLGAAALRVPVILDGVTAAAAALVAAALSPAAQGYWVAGHRQAEPEHRLALRALGMEPLLDLGMRLGDGTGALLALPILQAAASALADVATFDSAGVAIKNPG